MANAELHLDDILSYAQSEPDGRTQHLSFSPDAKMTITLDKSDILRINTMNENYKIFLESNGCPGYEIH